MKIVKTILIISILLLPGIKAEANSAANVRTGLAYLDKGRLEQAEAEFHKARFKKPESPEIAYNLGTVNYRRRNYAKAADFFQQAQNRAHDDKLKFNSTYNLGNALFKMGDYSGAVEAFKNSLDYKDDELARYNLGVAEERLEKQQQELEQDQQQGQDQQQEGDEQQSDDGQQQQQQGDQQSDSESGKSDDQQSSDEQQSGEQQQGDKSEDSDESQPGEPKSDGDESDSENQQQGTDGDSKDDEGNEGDEEGQMRQQERQDVQMAEQSEQTKPFEPSRRALELKHAELNQYRVEQILKEMEQREREIQLRYRNEQSAEQLDPFQMDAEQLRDFFENRRRPQQPSPSDTQDW